MDNRQKQLCNLQTKLHDLRKEVDDVSKSLKDVANKFQRNFKKSHIATIVGSTTGVVGGMGAVVGTGIADFASDVSMGLIIYGAVTGSLGGTVSVGASIAESVYRTKACKEAGELLNKFQQTRKNIVDSCNVIIDKLKQEGFENKCLTVITRQIGGQGGISIAELMHTNVSATKQVGEPATKCVLEFAGTAGRVASAMNKMTCATTKAIHMAGGFFGISVIAVDIRSLYRSVHAVSSDQLPETAKQICDLAEKLLETCPSDREIDEMIEDILQRL